MEYPSLCVHYVQNYMLIEMMDRSARRILSFSVLINKGLPTIFALFFRTIFIQIHILESLYKDQFYTRAHVHVVTKTCGILGGANFTPPIFFPRQRNLRGGLQVFGGRLSFSTRPSSSTRVVRV